MDTPKSWSRKKTRVDRFNDIRLLPALQKTFKSNPFLAVLSFALILLINSVTPLSFAWLTYRLYSLVIKKKNKMNSIQYWISIYSFIEVFWFFYQSYLFSKAQRKTQIPKLKISRIKELINHYGASTLTTTSTHYPDPTIFFSKWAFNTKYEDISIDNIIDWFSFAFFGLNSNQLHHNDLKQIKNIIHNFSDKYHLKLNKHTVDSVNTKFMKPFLYQIDIIKRPFIYYFVTDTILSNLGNVILKYNLKMKFECKKEGVLSYWVHVGKKIKENTEPPIILVHGVGAGIFMYVPFIMNTLDYENRKIIIINISCISMRYPSLNCDEIWNKSKTLNSIQSIFKTENINIDTKCIFIAHSFGSVILAWILNDGLFAVQKCIFIDPICFKLYEPDVTFNFVFRKPVNVPQLYLWYFICREFGIAHVIARHFWWFQNMLILNESNSQFIKVFLSEKDCIVNSKSIINYLQIHNVGYFVGEGHGHGSFLLQKIGWKKVRKWIDE